MVTTVNIPELKEKLLDRLKPTGWYNKLREFIVSADFDKILQFLWDERTSGKRFAPALGQMFRCFEECNYEDLKVIICGMDPYFTVKNGVTVADGLCFSCSNTNKLQPGLENIHKEIHRTVYNNQEYDYPTDLKRWANQGVLLYNAALSVEIGKADSHIREWKDFTTYLFDTLNILNSGVIWVFLGKKAQSYSNLISNNHYKFLLEHPSAAAYKPNGKWDSQNVFNQINEILYQNNKTQIIW